MLLKKKGIAFDAAEMKILIEAAVAELNSAYTANHFNDGEGVMNPNEMSPDSVPVEGESVM